MWRETNIFGVLLPPILGYMIVTTVIMLCMRALVFRLRWLRRIGNPALAQASLFLLILAVLVSIL